LTSPKHWARIDLDSWMLSRAIVSVLYLLEATVDVMTPVTEVTSCSHGGHRCGGGVTAAWLFVTRLRDRWHPTRIHSQHPAVVMGRFDNTAVVFPVQQIITNPNTSSMIHTCVRYGFLIRLYTVGTRGGHAVDHSQCDVLPVLHSCYTAGLGHYIHCHNSTLSTLSTAGISTQHLDTEDTVTLTRQRGFCNHCRKVLHMSDCKNWKYLHWTIAFQSNLPV